MGEWKRYIPEGTRDILFEECKNKVEIEYRLRETYRLSGFMEIKSPTLEFYDVFSEDKSTFPQERMYKLFDTQGRILVLRPDITTPIARISATKLKEVVRPLKLCYTSNVYRMNEILNGKDSEVTQSGIEIIGINSIEADAEVIITGINALINCGLKEFKIEIGHAKFFSSLIKNISLTLKQEEKLINLIANKNFTALIDFLENIKDFIDLKTLTILKELPMLFGDISILNKVEAFTENEDVLEIVSDIKKLYGIIQEAGLCEYVYVELGMVHNLNYYTGIIFRGYAEGFGGNILSGGRYDNLVENFGEKQGATGFAVDVDGIIKAIDKFKYYKKEDKVLIYYSEGNFKKAYEKALGFRKKGVIAEISLLDKKELAEEYAKSKQMKVEYII